jgi:hypothetical protein
MAPVTDDDPVRIRRRQIQRLAERGQRIGYALYGVAIVGFFAALITCLVIGSLFLAPAIVAGYAVKAAEREDREAGR